MIILKGRELDLAATIYERAVEQDKILKTASEATKELAEKIISTRINMLWMLTQ